MYHYYTMYLRENFKGYMISATVDHPNYNVVFAGHSLGGAFAALAMLDALHFTSITIKPDYPRLYTYGAPRVGNIEFVKELRKHVNHIYRVVHENDLVVHIPFCYTSVFTFFQDCEDGTNMIKGWYPYHSPVEIFYN